MTLFILRNFLKEVNNLFKRKLICFFAILLLLMGLIGVNVSQPISASSGNNVTDTINYGINEHSIQYFYKIRFLSSELSSITTDGWDRIADFNIRNSVSRYYALCCDIDTYSRVRFLGGDSSFTSDLTLRHYGAFLDVSFGGLGYYGLHIGRVPYDYISGDYLIIYFGLNFDLNLSTFDFSGSKCPSTTISLSDKSEFIGSIDSGGFTPPINQDATSKFIPLYNLQGITSEFFTLNLQFPILSEVATASDNYLGSFDFIYLNNFSFRSYCNLIDYEGSQLSKFPDVSSFKFLNGLENSLRYVKFDIVLNNDLVLPSNGLYFFNFTNQNFIPPTLLNDVGLSSVDYSFSFPPLLCQGLYVKDEFQYINNDASTYPLGAGLVTGRVSGRFNPFIDGDLFSPSQLAFIHIPFDTYLDSSVDSYVGGYPQNNLFYSIDNTQFIDLLGSSFNAISSDIQSDFYDLNNFLFAIPNTSYLFNSLSVPFYNSSRSFSLYVPYVEYNDLYEGYIYNVNSDLFSSSVNPSNPGKVSNFGTILLEGANNFLSFQLLPNFTLFNILTILVTIPLLVWILKLFLGG